MVGLIVMRWNFSNCFGLFCICELLIALWHPVLPSLTSLFVGGGQFHTNSNQTSSYLGTNGTEFICRLERETDAPWRLEQNEMQRNRCVVIVSGSRCAADLLTSSLHLVLCLRSCFCHKVLMRLFDGTTGSFQGETQESLPLLQAVLWYFPFVFCCGGGGHI